MIIVALFTIAEGGNGPSVHARVSGKTKHDAYTPKHYSALKGEAILAQATIWMSLEDITPRDISQSQTQILYGST